MSAFDQMIADDFAALRHESRQRVPSVESLVETITPREAPRPQVLAHRVGLAAAVVVAVAWKAVLFIASHVHVIPWRHWAEYFDAHPWHARLLEMTVTESVIYGALFASAAHALAYAIATRGIRSPARMYADRVARTAACASVPFTIVAILGVVAWSGSDLSYLFSHPWLEQFAYQFAGLSHYAAIALLGAVAIPVAAVARLRAYRRFDLGAVEPPSPFFVIAGTTMFVMACATFVFDENPTWPGDLHLKGMLAATLPIILLGAAFAPRLRHRAVPVVAFVMLLVAFRVFALPDVSFAADAMAHAAAALSVLALVAWWMTRRSSGNPNDAASNGR